MHAALLNHSQLAGSEHPHCRNPTLRFFRHKLTVCAITYTRAPRATIMICVPASQEALKTLTFDAAL
jgi:hypothetical protein